MDGRRDWSVLREVIELKHYDSRVVYNPRRTRTLRRRTRRNTKIDCGSITGCNQKYPQKLHTKVDQNRHIYTSPGVLHIMRCDGGLLQLLFNICFTHRSWETSLDERIVRFLCAFLVDTRRQWLGWQIGPTGGRKDKFTGKDENINNEGDVRGPKQGVECCSV